MIQKLIVAFFLFALVQCKKPTSQQTPITTSSETPEPLKYFSITDFTDELQQKNASSVLLSLLIGVEQIKQEARDFQDAVQVCQQTDPFRSSPEGFPEFIKGMEQIANADTASLVRELDEFFSDNSEDSTELALQGGEEAKVIGFDPLKEIPRTPDGKIKVFVLNWGLGEKAGLVSLASKLWSVRNPLNPGMIDSLSREATVGTAVDTAINREAPISQALRGGVENAFAGLALPPAILATGVPGHAALVIGDLNIVEGSIPSPKEGSRYVSWTSKNDFEKDFKTYRNVTVVEYPAVEPEKVRQLLTRPDLAYVVWQPNLVKDQINEATAKLAQSITVRFTREFSKPQSRLKQIGVKGYEDFVKTYIDSEAGFREGVLETAYNEKMDTPLSNSFRKFVRRLATDIGTLGTLQTQLKSASAKPTPESFGLLTNNCANVVSRCLSALDLATERRGILGSGIAHHPKALLDGRKQIYPEPQELSVKRPLAAIAQALGYLQGIARGVLYGLVDEEDCLQDEKEDMIEVLSNWQFMVRQQAFAFQLLRLLEEAPAGR